ncbi:methyl-accepting chemotaxis protein [Trinickia fusca]|uniref:Methyl-accepting chemotaxis protein n=1 Tax=Trinickia fusca TaxID=2419777 RepID=A0A494XPI6_9BURK|nr:methyl-accepting chemotaxis protein [Trinickia fusca]RKP52565.1 methyl-accepting chemotaxis protein [Trinickia fusca]
MLNKGLTIKARVGVAMAFLSALLLAIGTLGLSGMGSANRATGDIFTNHMPSAMAIENAEIYAARERLALDRAAFQAGLPGAQAGLDRSREMRKMSDMWWKKYLDLPREADEDRLAQDVSAKRDHLHQVLESFAAVIGTTDHDKIVSSANDLQVAFADLAKSDEALSTFQLQQAQAAFNDTQSSYATFRNLMYAALVVGLTAALLSFLSLRRAIARPLGEALAHFDAIATGDLRRPIVVRTRDEMGLLLEGLAKMQRSLVDTVRSVRSGGESIASAAKQIAAGNLDLSSRTEEQASSLEETAASMEELTGTVKQNADNARQASSLAANASEIAHKGSTVVGQVVGTMGDINESSAKIGDIITIIEGIAFQTNILALNAAVEAARAGEQGRGFAVVAGEVRGLAQRSSAAAKEIKELIDTSVERVRSGSALVDEAGRTMAEIMSAVQRVTDIMGEIAAASEEQSKGIDQVARAVTQMDEVTQQNAALVEEASAAAQSLEDQAGKLRTTVGVFQLSDEPMRPQAAVTRALPAVKPSAPVATPAAKAPAVAPKPAVAAAPLKTPRVTATPARTPARTAQAAPVRSTAAAAAPKPMAAAPSATASDDDWETF